jgi:predicted metal-binding protein
MTACSKMSAGFIPRIVNEGNAVSAATIFVCVTCRENDDAEARPGACLFDALRDRLAGDEIAVAPIECLAVCKRPCTIALAADGKWTYTIGDLSASEHLDDVVQGAQAYVASETGIVPWKERPQCFRKGVVSRTPPVCKS